MTWWRNLSRDTKVGLVTIALVVVGTLGCIGASWWEDRTPATRPGDPAIYQLIESSTNCTMLQQEFDAADVRRKAALSRGNNDSAEVNLSYMRAAEDRMSRLDC